MSLDHEITAVLLQLELVPLSKADANSYVEQHHRHSGPVAGHKFSVGAAQAGEVVGVAILGRPVNRVLDDGWTLEVLRVCTTGTGNVCSCTAALRSRGWKRRREVRR